MDYRNEEITGNQICPAGSHSVNAERAAALALTYFMAEYGWPLLIPTGKMTVRELWNCPDDLMAGMLKLPRREISRLSAFRKNFSAGKVLDELAEKSQVLVTLGEAGYPACLAQIHDPPPALFLCGKPRSGEFRRGGSSQADDKDQKVADDIDKRLAKFMSQPRVAIVGARAATRYGIDAATEIARSLARNGVCVVSGMALGIDAAAHRGAVAEKGGSIAVLGCGADFIYPRVNHKLYASLISTGLVVSEYPPGTKPMPWRFPARNRIMAGISDGVVVVEARERSGALITADFCLDAGREVFAVPGSIFSELSAGPHELIRNGATLVTGADDIIQALGLEPGNSDKARRESKWSRDLPEDLSEDERRLFHELDQCPCQQDTLAARAGIGGARAAAALVALELRGLARLDPGRGYTR